MRKFVGTRDDIVRMAMSAACGHNMTARRHRVEEVFTGRRISLPTVAQKLAETVAPSILAASRTCCPIGRTYARSVCGDAGSALIGLETELHTRTPIGVPSPHHVRRIASLGYGIPSVQPRRGQDLLHRRPSPGPAENLSARQTALTRLERLKRRVSRHFPHGTECKGTC
jgi:hypothetical protein